MGDFLSGCAGSGYSGLKRLASIGWGVSTVITIRRCVKDAGSAALARKGGRQPKERNFELEAAHDEVYHLTEAVKAQAIELAILRRKAGWGSTA